MPGRRLTAAIFLAALFGAVVGTLVTIAIVLPRTDGGEPERGTTVRVAADAMFWSDEMQMYCSDFHRYCVPRFEDPRDAHAFYLGDTHDLFRQAGCFVDWRPDFDLSNWGELTEEQRNGGAFRGGCSGSTFLPDGTRIFGPSPRNLDEFPVEVTTETLDGQELTFLEVDTTRLICGTWTASYRDPDDDPECELAPAFE